MEKLPSVFVVCPYYDSPTRPFFHSILSLFVPSKEPKKVSITYLDELTTDISKGRNNLAAIFLQSSCEWLLTTDADMEFTIKDVERLVSRGQKVIGGLYRQRYAQNPPVYVLNPLGDKPFDPAAGEVQEVRYVGTGFMLVHRSVLEEMIKAFPELEYFTDENEGNQKRWDFFDSYIYRNDTHPNPKRRLSCDWGFCQKWADMGGKVYVDTATRLTHHGRAAFK